jgi:hypothetical protein
MRAPAILPPIGCNGRGAQASSLKAPVSMTEPPIEEQFRLVGEAGPFDFMDRLPGEAEVDRFRAASVACNLPVRTTSFVYLPGRDDARVAINMHLTAAVGGLIHNFMIFPHHADGHRLSDAEIADYYLRAAELGAPLGVEPSFELHVNNWSEDPRRIATVADIVAQRGLQFNLTLDYSHMIFKIGNEAELEVSGIAQDLRDGRIVLDPFQPGNLIDLWLDMGIVRWLQVRSVAPDGPRNVLSRHDPALDVPGIPRPPIFAMAPGDPGRGILYPFEPPEPGAWHSPWREEDLAMTKQVVRKVLTRHHANPDSRLAHITTEMIALPDYALNAGFSLIGQNAAIARFIRNCWAEIVAGARAQVTA